MPKGQEEDDRVDDARARAADDQSEAEHLTDVTISGPGAADFIASPVGLDLPEADSSKGMGQTSDESILGHGRRLRPQLEPSDTDPETGAPPKDPLKRI
jgi:hypothetical protein